MTRNFAILPLLALPLLLLSCGAGHSASDIQGCDTLKFKYSKLLKVYKCPRWTVAEVANPWKEGEVLQTYVMVPKDADLPDSLPKGTLLRTPVERSVVFTSVHCGLLAMLGRLDAVKGVCDSRYILLPEVREHIRAGRAADMGPSTQPDVERIVKQGADALLVSAFPGGGEYDKLRKAGLPLVECADYMEVSPLARAEWMRFFGIVYGCEQEADSLFGVVDHNYKMCKAEAARTKTRPLIMSEKILSGVWYVPGGKSTIGQIYQDAGAQYVFADEQHSGSVTMTPEQVLAKAHGAEFWMIRSGGKSDITYDELAAENPVYRQIKAWKDKKIYFCNTEKIPFYDEEPFRPDYMLRDLLTILHPELGIKSKPRYFSPIK